MSRLNPKKDRSAKRKRNGVYWATGGRQVFNLISCEKCRREVNKTRDINAKCKRCKKDDTKEKQTKDSPAK